MSKKIIQYWVMRGEQINGRSWNTLIWAGSKAEATEKAKLIAKQHNVKKVTVNTK